MRIDGGLPLAIPAGIDKEELPAVTLGPALAGLSRTFPDRATYLEFWKEHPAFADNLGGDLLEHLTDYAGYT